MAKDPVTISAVVPCHNDETYIEECLDALSNQSLRPSEIIVCDDASSDRTLEIVRVWQAGHPDMPVTIVAHDDHVGISRNFNSGLLAASGDYVSMVAADDYWKPHKLEREYTRMREAGFSWAYSKVELRMGEAAENAVFKPFHGTSGDYEGDIFPAIVQRQVSPRCFLIERRVLMETGLFDESIGMYEDWDLKMRLSKRYPIAHVREANVIYRQHGGGEHHAPMYRHMGEIGKVLRKNKSLVAGDGAAVLRKVMQAFWPRSAMPNDRDRAARETALSSLDIAYDPVSIKSNGEGMIFLISLPRSGSTMLQRVLGSHPDIHTTAEPWVMLHPLYALKRTGLDAEYDAQVCRRALDDFVKALPAGEEGYYNAVRKMACSLYRQATVSAGKSRFLDKTPRYYNIMPELARAFPQAKFVLLLRNPLAVLASVLETWFNGNVEAYESSRHLRDMLQGPGLLAEAIETLGNKLIVTRYEDIVADPQAEIRRLCGGLGLPYFEPMLEYGTRPAPTGEFGDPQKVNGHNAPVADHLETWKDLFSSEELRAYAAGYLERIGDDVLSTLGYPLSTVSSELANCAGCDELGSIEGGAVSTARIVSAGEAAYMAGDIKKAEASFLEAYALDSTDIVACNNLVVLYWEAGDLEQALAYLDAAMKLDSTNRDVVINGGQIFTAHGYKAEAAVLYEVFLSSSPGDREVRDLYEKILSGDESGALIEQPEPDPASCATETDEIKPIDYSLPENRARAPKLGIVIPSFNQGTYLETAICSVLDQNYPNLELIVMDGGSTDHSVEIIKKYEKHISYWQSQRDKGQYWAVEAGLRRSTGDIMTWINSDDKLHPNSLNAVASVFTQLPEVDWLTGTPSIMNENGELTWVCSTPPVYSRQYYLEKRYDYPKYIQQEGTFWHRSLWDKAGGRLKTSLKMAGDLELWMRFFRHSRLYTTDRPLGCFRQHSGQKTDGGLELYRKEALKELNKEVTRFKKSNQTLPEKAPVIMIAGSSAMLRDLKREANGSQAASAVPGDILLTAIVSTYNSERHMEGCLQDLMSQTIADRLEVIVVDSGSQQNERAVVERYQKKYKNIRYFRTDERETIYSAWNRAVQEARGEYVSNANTDDRHRRDAYEKMVEVLQNNPDIALVYADSLVTTSANASFENAPVKAKFKWPEYDARLLFSVCYIGPQPVWRRSMHEKYGYFDAQMKVAGDYDFWLRMASSERFHHLAEELGLYLQSAGSIEHTHASDGVRESEIARQRNWPANWGQRPIPGGSYLLPITENNNRSREQRDPVPLVSIVMPTKNRLELLGRALDSVIAQTYRHWELIVVNDGGDDVAPVVDSRASGGHIRCITLEQSVGQAAARNIAFQEAKGQIICYLDDDDIYLAHHLETVVSALSREERPFVYTDAVLVPERHNNGIPQEVGERSNPYKHDEYSRDRLLVNNYIPINTWAHWKTCLDEVGVFDESLNCYEDWEFLLRLSARYEFAHVSRTTVEVMYRVDRVDNVTRQRLADTTDAYKAIYQRHGDSLSEVLVYEREMKLQALEYAAEQRLKNDQGSLGTPTGDGSPTFVPDKQRIQVLSEQFLRRAEESGYVLPSIHMIMLVGENDVEKIADTIDSLGQQVYAGWGLSVISTAPPPHQDFYALPMLEWIQSEDVKRSFLDTARQSECDWIATVMPGDTLEPEALSVFVDYINRNPDWRFIYSDEDCVDILRSQINHKFKPDINPDYLYSCPYTGNLSLVHRDMLSQLSADISIPAAVFYDLALKVLDNHGVSAIGHIPTLLYHQLLDNECREERETWVKPIIEAFVKRNDIDARVLTGLAAGTCMIDYRCSGTPEVCIAIYVGSDPARVERTVSSLVTKTAYSNWTIRLGVDRELAPQFAGYRSGRLSVDPLDRKTSRSAYFDTLAQTVDAHYMVFMDAGVIVLQDNWLDRLLAQGQRRDVGVVGVRLLSAHKRIAHAGILTGIGSLSVGGCIGEGDALEQEGYMQRAQVVQNLSAVSSACMLIKRSLYQSLQGFDAEIAVQLYGDVDFCLRVREAGKRVVWTPFVTMLISDDRLDTYAGDGGLARVKQDSQRITSTWLATLAREPAYNRNLTLKRADFSIETGFKPVWDPNIRDLPRISGCGAGSFVSWAYRVAQPLDALAAAGRASYSHVPFKGQTMDPLPSVVEMERIKPDVLLLQNTLHDHCLDSLREYRKMNDMFMVLGQDDLMFAIPPKSAGFKKGYKDIKKRLRTCLSLMDRLVVTGEPLAEELSGFIDDIRIVPNYLDAGMWGALESRRGCGTKPRVGWAGAMQHQGDLEILADAVRETADEVDWIFMGMCPTFLRPYVKEVHEYVAFNAYPETLARLNLDLAVAPLERNRFNRCKSNLRILEYGAMGWPIIATDIEPYRDAPVCLVNNQSRAWVSAIREHVHDLDAAWKAGDTLREWVRENCLLQGHLDDWLDALDPAGGSHRQSLVPDKASGL